MHRVCGLICCVLLILACGRREDAVPVYAAPEKLPVASIDLDSIQARGSLVLCTQNTSTSYFLYRGQPMGFDYDMVKSFADFLGVELEVVVESDVRGMFDRLNSGQADLIACNLTITEHREEEMYFSQPIDQTRMVLVQARPRNWVKLSPDERKDALVTNWDELDGKAVCVQKHSTFHQRLLELQRDSALSVIIVESPPGLDSEALVTAVARREIDYTVADENLARVNRGYFSNLDISVNLSSTEPVGWAIRKNADSLQVMMDYWLSRARNQRKLAYLSRKYFDSPKNQRDRAMSDYSSLAGGSISKYDDTLKKHAERLGWDWRWLASLVYHESRFNPQARSWAGAFGLMQLMPNTASRFGADSTSSAESNIRAGVDYLKYLEKIWTKRIADPDERKYFILASYNCGPGHVFDAQCLARDAGLDPLRWFDHVEVMLRRKQEPEFYTRDCVRHGYCRGSDATQYVRDISRFYRHYQRGIR